MHTPFIKPFITFIMPHMKVSMFLVCIYVALPYHQKISSYATSYTRESSAEISHPVEISTINNHSIEY